MDTLAETFMKIDNRLQYNHAGAPLQRVQPGDLVYHPSMGYCMALEPYINGEKYLTVLMLQHEDSTSKKYLANYLFSIDESMDNSSNESSSSFNESFRVTINELGLKFDARQNMSTAGSR